MPDQDVEQKRLDLDRERFNFEREQWQGETALKKVEQDRSRWANPLVIAIFTVAFAGLGNIVLAFVNGSLQRASDTERARETRELERSKSEALLVLEMIKTADPDKAAANLAFLADSGLLSDKDQVERIHTYLKQRTPGQGPSLPPSRGLKDYDRAIAEASRAIRLDPNAASAYVNPGLAYAAKGDNLRALKDFDRAIELYPSGYSAWLNRGLAHAAMGDYKMSLNDLSEAITLDSARATAFYVRGRVYAALQDYDRAIADYNTAIMLNPDSAYAVLCLYLARTRLGDQTAAAELETNAKKLKQTNWPYPLVELFLGRLTPETTLAAATKPDDRCEAQFYVGEWRLLRGDRPAANVALKAAEDTYPTDSRSSLARCDWRADGSHI
ncbi:MAG: tetratricopeptide repeat protein [Methylocella sp.]